MIMNFFRKKPINVADFRRLARQRLPRIVFDYLEGGAEDETGLEYNESIFSRYRFKPRRLSDVSVRTTTTSLFGCTLPAPLLIAPTGLNGLLWPNGDVVLARAAGRAGLPFILSTASTTSIEDVARQALGDLWFQLYVIHNEIADTLVARALAADYSTLVLTVDVGINGKRERDLRNGFSLPVRYTPQVLIDGLLHPRWSLDLVRQGLPRFANLSQTREVSTEVRAAIMQRRMDASFDWAALSRLREKWPRKLLVKGILDPLDATRCLDLGVDGIILSNHGARQLDCAVSPMEMLRHTAALTGKAPVLIDSGFRRGSDVVKAMIGGAHSVLLGRAVLYGLAANGEQGVNDVLTLLIAEIDNTLAQLGCATLSDLNPSMVIENMR